MSLIAQTMALGETLRSIAENDTSGSPSQLSKQVFGDWLRAAGPTSRQPGYFADVGSNFDISASTNGDLRDMFMLLQNYVESDEDEDKDVIEPRRTFIGLPIA